MNDGLLAMCMCVAMPNDWTKIQRRTTKWNTKESNEYERKTYLERVASSLTCFLPLAMFEFVRSTLESSEKEICVWFRCKRSCSRWFRNRDYENTNANERKIDFSSSDVTSSFESISPFDSRLDPFFLPPGVFDWFVCSLEISDLPAATNRRLFRTDRLSILICTCTEFSEPFGKNCWWFLLFLVSTLQNTMQRS